MYRKSFDLSVYFVADPHVCGGRAIEDVVASAVRGGATMVQLRNKTDSVERIEKQARTIQALLAESAIPFILNDYVALAAEIGADGVHIGQDDMKPAEARKIIGDDKILGLTAFTEEHYKAVNKRIVDYVGTGPVFPTLTKPDKTVLGVDGFAALVNQSPVPVVGIGGITPENAADVIAAGAQGVAMMRGVSEARDPEDAVRGFVAATRREAA